MGKRALAVSALLLVGGGILLTWYLYFAPRDITSTDLLVEDGRSVRGVLQDLQEQGLIASAGALRWYLLLSGDDSTIKAGEYRLAGRLSSVDIIGKLKRGEVKQYSVTLVEGWTFRDIRRRLGQAEPLLASTSGMTEAQIMRRLGRPGVSAEGQFFPDTYSYVRGNEDLQVLLMAMQRMQTVFMEEWDLRKSGLPYSNTEEALILASMVEEETAHPDDRAKIAGVFVRRLQLGIRLQSDATVIYGLGEQFDGDLRKIHLRMDTPWNTYANKGLPPTPIAAPGRASIRAALHPDDSSNLYFVAKGEGRSAFSSSLEEHNVAVRRYQLGLPEE